MFFLGIDGGGSKTEAVIIDKDMKVLGKGRAGPADIFNSDRETVKNNLISAIDKALEEADISYENLNFGGFGLPAVGEIKDAEAIYKKVIKEFFPKEFIVFNDVRGALEGAFPYEDGAVLLVGTGIMVMAKIGNEIVRIDGWGEHAGDCGSGYDIGRECLRYIFKMYDGRLEKSLMYDMVEENVEEIIRKTKGVNSRKYIASFSKIVCSSAEKNDKYALRILDNALEEWKLSILALKKKLKSNQIKLAVVGGLKNCKILYNKFLSWAEEEYWLKLSEPLYEPCIGSAILAMKEYEKLF
ncbi:MAG: N-acetylglucosamine kinase [Dictyoglomaceae bacterium]